MLSKLARRNRALVTIHWWMLQFGLDLRATARAISRLPRYLKNLRRFRKAYVGELRVLPSLHDLSETAGAVKSEYFWQDIYVAQRVFKENPVRHVDVGSRIDGFVTHLASFRAVEVIDIRPMQVSIPNVTFRQADLMRPGAELLGFASSLSCLHALEHFGLGRYGDPLSLDGHLEGLRNLALLVAPGGILYLACPTGRARVEFDSHRVMDPMQIVAVARGVELLLESLVTCSSEGFIEEADISADRLRELSLREYVLCIYIFRKNA